MASSTVESLPLTEVVEAADVDEVVNTLRAAREAGTAVYPLGGCTSLDFGLPAKREGVGLSLARLNQTVDYPSRDMTITVGAGMKAEQLSNTLAQYNQWLPIDLPRASEATVGGVVATNFSGARRFGFGTLRDYVIGVRAVSGTAEPFMGGGRVVKNVAGYDFCKLLTGSMGTLGVITELTFKLKPIPAASAIVACAPTSLNHVDKLLAGFCDSTVAPSAVEWVVGPEWNEAEVLGSWHQENSGEVGTLMVGLEGSEAEVSTMTDQLLEQWRLASATQTIQWWGQDAAQVWKQLAEFPSHRESPLVLQVSVVPRATMDIVQTAWSLDAGCSIQAHAGNGILIIRMSEFPKDGLSGALTSGLVPVAAAAHGNVIVLANPSGAEQTLQSTWGGIDAPFWLMSEIKRRFDPADILNPGRFVYR